jgi:hypothetical protein
MNHVLTPLASHPPAVPELPARLRPFRKITGGTLVGAAVVAVLVAQAEARNRRTPEVAREVPAPRPYAGPAFGVADSKETIGTDWLGVAAAPRPLKPERLDASPQLGSGHSAARGGPGAAWGPVARPEAAPRPSWAFAGLSAGLERTPNPTYRPAFVGGNGRGPYQAPDPLSIPMSAPGHLQWTKEED